MDKKSLEGATLILIILGPILGFAHYPWGAAMCWILGFWLLYHLTKSNNDPSHRNF